MRHTFDEMRRMLAFVALETLEGYLIDRDDPDSSALHIAFAKNKPSGRMARK